jgi:hypothetical protein
MKNTVLVFAIAFIALFSFNTAQAQNAHFSDIVVSEDGLTVSGKVAGLGNKFTGKDITITFSAEVAVNLECYAASGNGQKTNAGNSVKNGTATGTETIKGKNGQVAFTLTLEEFSALSAECPGNLIEGASSAMEVLNKTLVFSIAGTNVTGTITL